MNRNITHIWHLHAKPVNICHIDVEADPYPMILRLFDIYDVKLINVTSSLLDILTTSKIIQKLRLSLPNIETSNLALIQTYQYQICSYLLILK